MTESEKLKSKRGSSNRVRLGCAVLTGIAILIPVLCYGSMWLFARYGGEWATASDIPIPENSRLVITTYGDSYYRTLNRLFIHDDSPENLRQWFIDNGISMTPIPLDFEGESVLEYDDYYGTTSLFHLRSGWQELHDFAARYTSDWWGDFTPTCQAVLVYQSVEAVLSDFPEVDIPTEGTLFMIRTCWPNVN
jgi:hypothetical protein